jgi:U4/U6.U5 tri-snRNP-associated protein 2
MQATTLASNNKFKIVEHSDSINYLSWFLNISHEYLSKKTKNKTSIISESFQGKLKVETFSILKDSEKLNYNDIVVEEEGIKYKYEFKEQNF